MRGRGRCQKRPFSTMSLQHNKIKKDLYFQFKHNKNIWKSLQSQSLDSCMLWDTLNLKKDETNSFFGSQAFGRLRMVLSLFLSYQFNKDRTNHSLPKTLVLMIKLVWSNLMWNLKLLY